MIACPVASALFLIPLNMRAARRFVVEHHYAKDWGAIGKLALGLEWEGQLVGAAIWGYGTRPLHTIQRCFPSLTSKDYLELVRLCVLDQMPRNTETQFLKMQIAFIKANYPPVKVLLSWADGMRGKPGFVYQAASWLYGGFIWSEFYVTLDGEVIHPRLLITRYGRRDKTFTLSRGLTKVHGFQFRYCKFLCSKGEAKRLLRESPFRWGQNYPKLPDLVFEIDAGEGARESRELPMLKGSGRFRHPAPLFEGIL